MAISGSKKISHAKNGMQKLLHHIIYSAHDIYPTCFLYRNNELEYNRAKAIRNLPHCSNFCIDEAIYMRKRERERGSTTFYRLRNVLL